MEQAYDAVVSFLTLTVNAEISLIMIKITDIEIKVVVIAE